MAEPEFTLNLSDADFELVASPELALLKARRELEGRLRWLDERLAPDSVQARRRTTAGRSLADAGVLSGDTIRAISELIAATDPTAHGERLAASNVAVVVELAIETARSLDKLIEATQARVAKLTGKNRLAYALLNLPTATLLALAKEHSVQLEESSVSRPSIVRQLVARASKQDWTSDLERAVPVIGGES